ncbi:uncharacterized protein LOC121385101 [Gigantopelta aegis]|uniref:uncharacterized protein LOC121385101 n=1 Tax=Gigantopelta aegis TaxID=1735272 RepID=UPI001B889A56|nr:uncharacterized protein LOC121385101 [Gigantopelta aegis]
MAAVRSTCRVLLLVFGGILLLLPAVTDGLAVLFDVTWDSAISTCRERGGKLYNTTNTSALGDVTPGSYWIGGKVQYSSWMWTEDKKHLFEYAGEMNESYATSNPVYSIIYDNQASRCYYECRRQQHDYKPMYVGLQDSTCYCFDWSNPGNITTDNRTHRGCLGNFMEYCGTDSTISIYRPELLRSYAYITWLLSPDGTCAYITQSLNIIVKTEDNCMTQKGYICNSGSRLVNNYLNRETIQRMDWPAYSPDLKPIVHAWDSLQQRISKRPQAPNTLQELADSLEEEWHQIPQAEFRNLVQSFPRRCRADAAVYIDRRLGASVVVRKRESDHNNFDLEGSLLLGGNEVFLEPSSQEKRDSENDANTHDVTPVEPSIDYGDDYIVIPKRIAASKMEMEDWLCGRQLPALVIFFIACNSYVCWDPLEGHFSALGKDV